MAAGVLTDDLIEREQIAWAFNPGDVDDLVSEAHQVRTVSRLIRLALHPSPVVRAAAAANKRCPVEVMVRVATVEPTVETLAAVASNPACPEEWLRGLFDVSIGGNGTSPVMPTLVALFKNPACPPDVMRRWDPYGGSRSQRTAAAAALASNPALPDEMWDSLLGFTEDDVVRPLVRNPSCPTRVLQHVLGRDPKWAQAIVSNPNCPPEAFEVVTGADSAPHAREVAARQKHCPSEVISRLVHDADAAVRAAAARNTPLVDPWLDVLSVDPSNRVRRPVAGNVNTRPSTVVWMAEHDRDRTVRKAAALAVTNRGLTGVVGVDPSVYATSAALSPSELRL